MVYHCLLLIGECGFLLPGFGQLRGVVSSLGAQRASALTSSYSSFFPPSSLPPSSLFFFFLHQFIHVLAPWFLFFFFNPYVFCPYRTKQPTTRCFTFLFFSWEEHGEPFHWHCSWWQRQKWRGRGAYWRGGSWCGSSELPRCVGRCSHFLFAVGRVERLQWEGPAGGLPHEGQQGSHRLPLQQGAVQRQQDWRAGGRPGQPLQEVSAANSL